MDNVLDFPKRPSTGSNEMSNVRLCIASAQSRMGDPAFVDFSFSEFSMEVLDSVFSGAGTEQPYAGQLIKWGAFFAVETEHHVSTNDLFEYEDIHLCLSVPYFKERYPDAFKKPIDYAANVWLTLTETRVSKIAMDLIKVHEEVKEPSELESWLMAIFTAYPEVLNANGDGCSAVASTVAGAVLRTLHNRGFKLFAHEFKNDILRVMFFHEEEQLVLHLKMKYCFFFHDWVHFQGLGVLKSFD